MIVGVDVWSAKDFHFWLCMFMRGLCVCTYVQCLGILGVYINCGTCVGCGSVHVEFQGIVGAYMSGVPTSRYTYAQLCKLVSAHA